MSVNFKQSSSSLNISAISNISETINEEQTSFFNAVRNLNVSAISNFLESTKFNPNFYVNSSQTATPLIYCICTNKNESIRILCKSKNVDLNMANQAGLTPFWLAAYNGNIEALSILHASGANGSTVSKRGEDALYISAKNGHIDCVKFLVERGFAIDKVCDSSGCTSLGISAYGGHLNIVKYLQYKGASLTKSDSKGENTPIMLSTKAGQIEIVEYLLNFEQVNKHINKFEFSPMVYAITSKNERLVSIFLKSKFDVFITNERNETILFHSIKSSSLNIIKLLFSTYKKLDAENIDGITPFMYAFLQHAFEIVDVMRDYGADVNFKNSHGDKICDIAIRNGDDAIIDYLKSFNLINANIDFKFNDPVLTAELSNLNNKEEINTYIDLKDIPDWANNSIPPANDTPLGINEARNENDEKINLQNKENPVAENTHANNEPFNQLASLVTDSQQKESERETILPKIETSPSSKNDINFPPEIIMNNKESTESNITKENPKVLPKECIIWLDPNVAKANNGKSALTQSPNMELKDANAKPNQSPNVLPHELFDNTKTLFTPQPSKISSDMELTEERERSDTSKAPYSKIHIRKIANLPKDIITKKNAKSNFSEHKHNSSDIDEKLLQSAQSCDIIGAELGQRIGQKKSTLTVATDSSQISEEDVFSRNFFNNLISPKHKTRNQRNKNNSITINYTTQLPTAIPSISKNPRKLLSHNKLEQRNEIIVIKEEEDSVIKREKFMNEENAYPHVPERLFLPSINNKKHRISYDFITISNKTKETQHKLN